VIPAGKTYLVKLETKEPAGECVVKRALVLMGFTDVLVTSKNRIVTAEPGETSAAPWTTYTAIARVPSSARMSLKNVQGARWTLLHPLAVDPYEDLVYRSKPFGLVRDHGYDLRLLSNDRRHPRRRDVREGLVSMGFDVGCVVPLRKCVHLPGHHSQSFSEWIATTRWDGASTVVANPFPFLFEQVRPNAMRNRKEKT